MKLKKYLNIYHRIIMDDYEKNLIRMAIIKIHCNAEYFEGMDILTRLVGWPDLLNQFYTEEEKADTMGRFNRWVAKLRERVDICKGLKTKIRVVK